MLVKDTRSKHVSVIVVIVCLIALVIPFRKTRALELASRSIVTTSSIPSAVTSEVFQFTVQTASTVGSIEFEYCSNSPLYGIPCVAPTGFSAIGSVLSAQTTNVGFTKDIINSNSNRIVLTRPAANAVIGASSYTFTNITNPSTTNETVYVRIALYGSVDATGPRGDYGAVAFSVTGGFSVGAFVPPYLIFCSAITVALDCSSTSGVLISFGELLTTQTRSASSQFSGATNDPTGYSVSIIGQTMTAGNQVIPPLASNASSTIGTSQFGINLRANTVPSVGADTAGAGTSIVNAAYNMPNSYRFVNGEQLTNSTLPTDFNVHTVSYIVNIGTAQQPGYYATTMTYVALAAF